MTTYLRLKAVIRALFVCRSLGSRFTFQVAFWDALKSLEEGASRRAGSLARLMAHLVLCKQLSLTVLKVIRCCAAWH